MSDQPNISKIASLLGEPARAKIMTALLGGKALTATELAIEADISASTASSHLSKLHSALLISVQKQGRHKYFQIFDYHVAELIESLFNISSRIEHSRVPTGPKDTDLRLARICYDHLAGDLAVQLLASLIASSLIIEESNQIRLSESGTSFFNNRHADITKMQKLKRPTCRNCLDWSERKFHLAGSLGKWILNDIIANNWAHKDLDSRVIRFESAGFKAFKKTYQIDVLE